MPSASDAQIAMQPVGFILDSPYQVSASASKLRIAMTPDWKYIFNSIKREAV
jgi:hypothetical protein